MLDIVEKTTDQLRHTEETNSKITYTTYVKVHDKDELCTVFNAEQLLKDIHFTDDGEDEVQKYVDEKLHSDRVILAAEDSGVAREVLNKFFKKTGAKYEIYTNGSQLIKRLEELDPQDVGMILTDIEMPGTDGYQVASFVKNSKLYSEIPVIVNSSMTTDAVRGKMKQIGVDGFVGKTDIPTLFDYTKRFLLH
jgi:two-component system chemotaxis response regulator CheV